MPSKYFHIVLTLLLVGGLTSVSLGQTGDLSDDILNPSIFNIGNGSSTLSIANSVSDSDQSDGTSGNPAADIDFFNVVVAVGYQLDAINLISFDGGGNAFFGFAENQLGGNPSLGAEQGAFVATALGFTLIDGTETCLLYTSPSPRDATLSRMPSSA